MSMIRRGFNAQIPPGRDRAALMKRFLYGNGPSFRERLAMGSGVQSDRWPYIDGVPAVGSVLNASCEEVLNVENRC